MMMNSTSLLLTQPPINLGTFYSINLTMEGSAKSVVCENTFAQLWPNHKVPSVKSTLKIYTDKKLKPVGVITSLSVEVNN